MDFTAQEVTGQKCVQDARHDARTVGDPEVAHGPERRCSRERKAEEEIRVEDDAVVV